MKQRTRTNTSSSCWEEIISGVPQGLILGPIFFHIFMCDLCSVLRNIEFSSYADDNKPCVIEGNTKESLRSLELASNDLLEQFSNNKIKASPDKVHLLTSLNDELKIRINDVVINSSSKCKKLLGVIIDNTLNFNNHNNLMSKETGQKTPYYPK